MASVIPLLSAAAFAVVVLSSCSDEPREVASTSSSSTGPQTNGEAPVDSSWRLLWRVGGEESDTTLLQPSRLLVSNNLLLVLDGGRRGVTALDRRTGVIKWLFESTGSGPGEVRAPLAAAPLRDGRTALYDVGNRRVVFVSPDGEADATVTLGSIGQLHSFCELREGQFLGFSFVPDQPVVTFSAKGEVIHREGLPWAKEAEQLDLSAQSAFVVRAGSNEGCVIAGQHVPSWAVLSATGWSPVYKYDSPVTAAGKTPPEVLSAISVPDDGTVMLSVVLPEGERAGVLRRYSTTGRELDVWRLPTPPVNRVVWQDSSGDTVFVLHGMNGLPTLSAYEHLSSVR